MNLLDAHERVRDKFETMSLFMDSLGDDAVEKAALVVQALSGSTDSFFSGALYQAKKGESGGATRPTELAFAHSHSARKFSTVLGATFW